MKRVKCACQGSFLEKFVQPAVLLELQKQPHTAPSLLRLTQARQKSEALDPAGFYRTLKRMEEQGLIASDWDMTHRHPVRIFQMTAQGSSCFANWQQTLTAYRDNLNSLLEEMQQLCASNAD